MNQFVKSKLLSFLSVSAAAGMTCLLALSLFTIKAHADDGAACVGLGCSGGSDCGTKCFCNGPSGKCFLDE